MVEDSSEEEEEMGKKEEEEPKRKRRKVLTGGEEEGGVQNNPLKEHYLMKGDRIQWAWKQGNGIVWSSGEVLKATPCIVTVLYDDDGKKKIFSPISQ